MTDRMTDIASSPGYRSLKAAYIRDVTGRSGRSKAELYRHFQWVIGRAKHYAHHQERSVGEVLDKWEHRRNSWWLSYYQNNHQPKLGTKGHPGVGKTLRGLKKWYRRNRMSAKHRRARIQDFIRHQQEKAGLTRVGTKARWTMARKRRAAEIRRYTQSR